LNTAFHSYLYTGEINQYGSRNISIFKRKYIEELYFPIQKRARLRHILKLGALSEKRGEKFYRRCSRKSLDPAVRELCQRLAEDEADHYRVIDDQLSRWNPVRVSKRKLRELDTQGLLTSLFTSPPEPTAKTEEIIEYSIDVENKMIAFYEEYASHFLEIWKVEKLQRLVEDERGHIRDLELLRGRFRL